MSRKNFKNEINPALQFISGSANEAQEEKDVSIKRNPMYIETKSKRFQLLLQPSLHSSLKVMADQKETSLNDLIHTILEQAAKKNK